MGTRKEFLENLGNTLVAAAFPPDRPGGTAQKALEALAAYGSDIRKFLALSQPEKDKYLEALGIKVQPDRMTLCKGSEPNPLELEGGSDPILRWWKKGYEWVGFQVTFRPEYLDGCNEVLVWCAPKEGKEGAVGVVLDNEYVQKLAGRFYEIDAFIAGSGSGFKNPGGDASFENFFWRRGMPLGYGEVWLIFVLKRYRYFPKERRTFNNIETVRKYKGTNMPELYLPPLRK